MDIVIPTVGESVASAVIGKWLKPDGAFVKRDEAVVELETDKVNMEIVAPGDGVLRHKSAEGDTVDIGATIAVLEPGTAGATAKPAAKAESGGATKPAAVATTEPPSERTAASSHGHESNGDVRATPLARKVAEEHGVDLARDRKSVV